MHACMAPTASCELHTACPQVRHWGLSNETTFGVCKVRGDVPARAVLWVGLLELLQVCCATAGSDYAELKQAALHRKCMQMCEVAAKLGVPPPVSIQNDFS